MKNDDATLEKVSVYCEECKSYIPVEIYNNDTSLVICPKCIGECPFCDCHLKEMCFQSISPNSKNLS